MAHCPECNKTLATDDDVEFVDLGGGSRLADFLGTRERYLIACGSCGAVVAGGVAGRA